MRIPVEHRADGGTVPRSHPIEQAFYDDPNFLISGLRAGRERRTIQQDDSREESAPSHV